MPELPEVETIVNRLKPHIQSQKIIEVSIPDKKALKNIAPQTFKERLVGTTIKKVRRKGKFIIIAVSNDLFLAIHLRMTGKLLVLSPEDSNPPYPRVVFRLKTNKLIFDDMRRLGTLHLLSDPNSGPLAKLGLEPFSEEYTLSRLKQILQSTQEIKRLLLDQKKIVGIGNIYACEILFKTKLNPWKKASNLGEEEIKRLYKAIPAILSQAIKAQGTTIDTYETPEGKSGNFQFTLQVYGREDKPCPRCKSVIKRDAQGGRSTYYCPSCQTSNRKE